VGALRDEVLSESTLLRIMSRMGLGGRGRGLRCRAEPTPIRAKPWVVVLGHLVVLLRVPMVGGCVFDCHTGALCGGEVQVVLKWGHPESCPNIYVTHGGWFLGLANRGITEIAEHGLDCYWEGNPPNGNPSNNPNVSGDWVFNQI
jgi:hypothetical protein